MLLVLAFAPFPLARGEIAEKNGVRVSVEGEIVPTRLPRTGTAPVAVTIGGKIGPTSEAELPQLRTITIEINRHGILDYRGLPICPVRRISPSTTRAALGACRASLVGDGTFSANVKFPGQSPFPSRGKVLAFNGRLHGRPVILAHIYGTHPAPTSYVLPFEIRFTRGTFGTVLRASLPNVTGTWGYVTGVSMTLSRRFSFLGRPRSYVAAGCPAAAGFRSAFFPLARTEFVFAGDVTLTSTLSRKCRVQG